MKEYEEAFRRSIEDPDGFWDEATAIVARLPEISPALEGIGHPAQGASAEGN